MIHQKHHSSHQLRDASTGAKSANSKQLRSNSFYDRVVYWKQEKLKKIKEVGKEQAAREKKGLVFRPDLKESERSINKLLAGKNK